MLQGTLNTMRYHPHALYLLTVYVGKDKEVCHELKGEQIYYFRFKFTTGMQ